MSEYDRLKADYDQMKARAEAKARRKYRQEIIKEIRSMEGDENNASA